MTNYERQIEQEYQVDFCDKLLKAYLLKHLGLNPTNHEHT